MTHICLEWEKVGDLLGIEMSALMTMKEKKDMNSCRNVIYYWQINNKMNYPFSWEGFCKLLNDMALSSIAEKLMEALTEGNLCT